MIPPRRLVLSGGGIKVISLVGTIKVLEEKGILKQIKEVCGVSAGAFLGLLIASGYPLKKIERLVSDLEFGIIRNVTPEAFLEFPETFGIDNGKNIIKFLESIFRVALKIDPQITFEQFVKLRRPGQVLFRCWATDLNTHAIREFSFTKTPSVKIIDALKASMCLPLYFIPCVDPINGHLLTDGGIQGNIPLHHLSQNECQESLAIGFSKPIKIINAEPINDLFEFINALLCSSSINTRNEEFLKKWSHKIIRISVDDYPSWNFEASREDKLMLLKKGIDAAHLWIQNKACGSRIIRRRVSV